MGISKSSIAGLMLAGAALIMAVPASAAVVPVGPQADVAKSDVTSWGWSVCWSGLYGGSESLESVLGGCNGAYLMLAGAQVGSDDYTVLAAALASDVTFLTPADSTSSHTANGSEWYYNSNYSWGFAPEGATLNKNSCDYGDGWPGTDPLRLCWHTGGGNLNGGWRAGTTQELNGSQDWERFILVADRLPDNQVPEPATLALLGAGLFGLGLARRRR